MKVRKRVILHKTYPLLLLLCDTATLPTRVPSMLNSHRTCQEPKKRLARKVGCVKYLHVWHKAYVDSVSDIVDLINEFQPLLKCAMLLCHLCFFTQVDALRLAGCKKEPGMKQRAHLRTCQPPLWSSTAFVFAACFVPSPPFANYKHAWRIGVACFQRPWLVR